MNILISSFCKRFKYLSTSLRVTSFVCQCSMQAFNPNQKWMSGERSYREIRRKPWERSKWFVSSHGGEKCNYMGGIWFSCGHYRSSRCIYRFFKNEKKKKKNDLEHKNIGRNFKKTMGQIETYHSIQSVTEM